MCNLNSIGRAAVIHIKNFMVPWLIRVPRLETIPIPINRRMEKQIRYICTMEYGLTRRILNYCHRQQHAWVHIEWKKPDVYVKFYSRQNGGQEMSKNNSYLKERGMKWEKA